MALTLYAFPGDFRALKAQIAAQYNGITLNRPDFVSGVDDVKKEFVAKNPAGKVPLLETPEGVLFESNAIARYIARIRRDTELYGRTFFDSAQVDAWVDFTSHDVELPATMWIYPILGYMDFKQAVHDKAVGDLHKALSVVESHLLSRTFLVGEAVTLADIVLAATLFYPFKLVLDEAARAAYPSVTRWFVTCVNQPAFAAVLGEVPLAEKALGASAAVPHKAAAAAAGAGAEKAAKAPKAPKAAAAPKPAAEPKPKKKEEAPPADDGGDDDMGIPKEAKKADPLAALPKSTLVLDEWKRTYSNSKHDFTLVMPWFWEHLDKAGYTLWLQKYKYNAENTKDFMTSNLVGGFIQRSEEMRKYAFGVMHVLNTAAPYEVEGCWLIRGGEDGMKAMLEANPDAEYFDFTRLDPEKAEDRATVQNYWCCTETLNGKVVYDTRQFK